MKATNTKNIQAIILAAGQSKRYGSNKTHICIDGIPMPIKISLTLQSININSLIVINESNIILQQSVNKHAINYIINNEETNTGIGSSIALAVQSTPDANGWLICLADMPFININTYKKIISTLQESNGKHIIIPRYNKKNGHPVAFGNNFYQQLINKSGDTGAKNIINNNLTLVDYIDINDPFILQDIDTPQDFKRLANLTHNKF